MAKLDHPSFTQPHNFGVALWRYMDLSKFVALLQRRRLVFPRADKLGDPFEGSVPEPNVRAPEEIRRLRRYAPQLAPFAELDDDQFTALFAELSEGRRLEVRRKYVSCWHMNEGESAAMWKLYSRSSDAVCIRTDYATLARLLPDTCYMGVIRYIDFRKEGIPGDNTFAPFLVKRASFAHEREARAILNGPASPGSAEPPLFQEVPIDVGQCVQEVFVSPESPEWFREVVQGVAKTYGLDVDVRHSEMNGTPMY